MTDAASAARFTQWLLARADPSSRLRLSSLAAWVTSALVSVGVITAHAEELVRYKQFQASAPGGFVCKPDVEVRIDAPDESHFQTSRVDRQEMANLVRAYIWIDCPEIETINFVGHAAGESDAVFHGTASKADDWFLNEGQAATEATEKPATPQADVAPAPTNKTRDELEALAAQGDEGAMLYLARHLIGKPPSDSELEFEIDRPRGIELLERLVRKGNAEAVFLLAEAYLEDAELPLNLPLISEIDGLGITQDTRSREQLTAEMMLNAAANGSETAVESLHLAGEGGESTAYLALAQMFTRDTQGKMPYRGEFQKKKLRMRKTHDAKKHHRVGLHYFEKASQSGNAQASQLLKELGLQGAQRPSNTTAQGSSVEQDTSSDAARHLTAVLPELAAGGAIERILEARAGESAQTATTSSAGSAAAASSTGSSVAAQAQTAEAQGGSGTPQASVPSTRPSDFGRGGHIGSTRRPPSFEDGAIGREQLKPLIID